MISINFEVQKGTSISYDQAIAMQIDYSITDANV